MIDWKDKRSVLKYCKKLSKSGVKLVVFKHPDRSNYNITAASRTDRYDPSWVVT